LLPRPELQTKAILSLVTVLVPEVVRNKALAAGAAAWLDELPSLIAARCSSNGSAAPCTN
jgi:hypothetical protein